MPIAASGRSVVADGGGKNMRDAGRHGRGWRKVWMAALAAGLLTPSCTNRTQPKGDVQAIQAGLLSGGVIPATHPKLWWTTSRLQNAKNVWWPAHTFNPSLIT